MGQRQQVMALCAVMVLQFQIYNQADAKLTKLVWDLHKKVHVLVHVYIVWLYTLYGCIYSYSNYSGSEPYVMCRCR